MSGRPVVSPLAWRLSYQYPVHLIGATYRPKTPPASPTFLIVYRNRSQQVHFLATNAVTVRLLQVLEEGNLSGREALLKIAEEMQQPDATVILEKGYDTLVQLRELEILCGVESAAS